MNACCCAVALSVFALTAFAGATREYEVKAAYVYNFARFTDWPSTGQLNAMTICVYGKDPFAGLLDDVVTGKTAHGVPMLVRRISPGETVESCQVLFLSSTVSNAQINTVLSRTEGRPILTIGESRSFAEHGGMLGLVVEEDHVRFDINITAIAAAHLRASSRLIELGRVVGAKR